MSVHEVNFDGLIGPTHNYAGLSFGNLASASHAQHIARPKLAALQGLEKMRTLVKLGYKQGFFLPQQRPRLDILQQLGFGGSPRQIIEKSHRQAPELLPMVYSASSMWAANAATVTPSMDSGDGRVHFTPANLLTTAHRAFEHRETSKNLQRIFAHKDHFTVHQALPAHTTFADEGAANHTRLCAGYDSSGIGLFVYGRDQSAPSTQRFPARQALEASRAIVRQHSTKQALYLRQNPRAIDAGAFHNDVVAVGNGPCLFHHEDAFDSQQQVDVFASLAQHIPFAPVTVPNDEVSLEDAIGSYLFNSQLLGQPDGGVDKMRLIAPQECRENPRVSAYLKALVKDSQQPIQDVTFVDVRQSMSNGGGPACLRLRVALNDQELAAVDQRFLCDEHTIDLLSIWVSQYYRDEIGPEDLADPALLEESYTALDALCGLLGLGDYYDFQMQ